MSIETVIILEPTVHTDSVCRILGPQLRITRGPLSRAQLLAAIEGTDAVFARLAHRLDEEVFRRASRLRVIATPTTGLTHIDMAAARSAGVDVLSLRGEREFLADLPATAELTWGLLLSVVRRIPAASRHTARGRWDRNEFRGRELAGKTLGIIGLGRVGRIVARYAAAFGMDVIAFDPHVSGSNMAGIRCVAKDTLLRTADVVSLHAEYNQGDPPILGRDDVPLMKNGSILINTGRGELIDERALVDSIISGRVAGLGLDVMTGEPTVNLDIVRLQDTHNVVVTPHIGGATLESTEKTELFMARKLKTYIEQVHDGGDHRAIR